RQGQLLASVERQPVISHCLPPRRALVAPVAGSHARVATTERGVRRALLAVTQAVPARACPPASSLRSSPSRRPCRGAQFGEGRRDAGEQIGGLGEPVVRATPVDHAPPVL